MSEAQSWEEKNYSIVITEDGSPSLYWQNSAGGETMHHRGGALSETEQIYGSVVTEGILTGMRSFLSVGLGLGYNELMVARELSRKNISLDSIQILSFEADAFLAQNFLDFVRSPQEPLPTQLIYSEILRQMVQGDQDEAEKVLSLLRKLYAAGKWQIKEALGFSSIPENHFEVILYDAFSSKTTPELWSEEFLMGFLSQVPAKSCLFSTYACTGALKRSLKLNHFELHLREGFHGKRNSTLGRRHRS